MPTNREFYDDASGRLDSDLQKYPYEEYRFHEITKAILNFIPLKYQQSGSSRIRVLDIGCGTGGLTEHLPTFLEDAEICGVDFSPKMAKQAQQKLDGCNFIAGDAHILPFKDQTFDLVVSREVLEHLDAPLAALYEVRRVLKKEGIIIASTPSWFGFIAPLYFLKKLIGGMQPLENWWTPFSLAKTFKKAGLKTRIQTVCPTPYHGYLPKGLVPLVEFLDSVLYIMPCIRYFGRNVIIKARWE